MSASAISGRTHCRNGHKFEARTTKWSKGTRICLVCYEARKKQKKKSPGKTLVEVFAEEKGKNDA